ncbi:MAG: NifB/NifX family molybdenum-iron cluster-binding protein [Candidatus Aureabacteria bacterium]|nr:NifB/NifX family molybdenum-iron cluster-binding protein [Candidatus Auribacterota bacterium]NLW95097.1 diguanylate cyclase [Chlamydiota bacterium]
MERHGGVRARRRRGEETGEDGRGGCKDAARHDERRRRVKLFIPVTEEKGLQSPIHGHFGSAPIFLCVDTESKTFETVHNDDKAHAPGACNPLKAIGGRAVDAVVAGGIGMGALTGFRKAGIRVFHAGGGTVADALSALASGGLPELDRQASCAGHDAGGGGCAHS